MAAREEKSVVVPKTSSELQRMKLDKLLKNPTKEISVPDKSKEWNPKAPPEFIRNVWGSSAGAGSGDFHVYRGIRRREYARQKFISEKAEKDQQDIDYHQKVEENKRIAEERTSKRRNKRQKKKAKEKAIKKLKINSNKSKDNKEKEESEEENRY